MAQDERLPIVRFFPTEQMPEYHNIAMSAIREDQKFQVTVPLAKHLLQNFPENFKSYGRVAKQLEKEIREQRNKIDEVQMIAIDVSDSELPPDDEEDVPKG